MKYVLNEENSQLLSRSFLASISDDVDKLSDKLCAVDSSYAVDSYKYRDLAKALIIALKNNTITEEDINFILSNDKNIKFMIDNMSPVWQSNYPMLLNILLKFLKCNLGYNEHQFTIFLGRSPIIDRIINQLVKNHPDMNECSLYKEYITDPRSFINKYIHQNKKTRIINDISEFSSKDYEIIRTDINEFIHRYYYTLKYLYNKVDLINGQPIGNVISKFLIDDISSIKNLMYIHDLYLDFSGIYIRNAYHYYPLNCYIEYDWSKYDDYNDLYFTFSSIISNYILNKLKTIFYNANDEEGKLIHDFVSYDDMFEYIIDNASKYHLILEREVCHDGNYYEHKRNIINTIMSFVEDSDNDKAYLFKPLNKYVLKGVWKYFSKFVTNVLLDILAYCVMDSEGILKEMPDHPIITNYIIYDYAPPYNAFKDRYIEDVSSTYRNYISAISSSYGEDIYERYDINVGILHTIYELYRLNNNNAISIDNYNEVFITNIFDALDRYDIRDLITKDDILKMSEVMSFIDTSHLQFLSKDELVQEIKRYINIKNNVYLLNHQGDELSSDHDMAVFDGELDDMGINIRSKLPSKDYLISDFIMVGLFDPLSSKDGITLNLLNSLIGKYGNLPLYAQLIGSCSADKGNTRNKFKEIMMKLKNGNDVEDNIIKCVSIILKKKFKLNVDENFVKKFVSQITPNLNILAGKDNYDFHILSDVFDNDRLLSLMNKIMSIIIDTDDRSTLNNIGLEYIEELYKHINNEEIIYKYIKRFSPLEWHDALLWVSSYCYGDKLLFDIESLSNILNTISNIDDAIKFRRNISKYNPEIDDQELPISNLNDFIQRAILTGDRELKEIIDQSSFLKPVLFAPDLENPTNYIKRNIEKLKDLAEGSLDGKQKLKPISKSYQYIIISNNILNSNVISGSDRSRNLRELISKALGSRRNNIPAVVDNPSGLFKDLNKLLPDSVVSFLNKDTQINKNLYMNICDELSKYGMKYDIYDFIAQIHSKSDVQGWLAGSYTDCCMPFGSTYNHDYMFKENTQQFTIQCRKNLFGTHNIIAQSVVVIFDENNKYNLPKGIILDNIEITRSYQKPIYKNLIDDIYRKFWTEFSDCPVYIGTSCNDVIPSSDRVNNPYQHVMINDFIYSDARKSWLYKLRKNPNVIPINKRIVLGNISVNKTSANKVYKLQKEIYNDNKGLWYNENQIYEILDQSRDNNERYDKSVNSAFISIGKNMIGYILIAIDDEDFVHLHVYDLAIKEDSNTAYLMAIRYIFGVASANELPIVFEARESTSYKAVKSGVLEQYAKRMGYEKVEDKELPDYMGGETFHRVVLKPIKESLQEDIDYETYLLLYS